MLYFFVLILFVIVTAFSCGAYSSVVAKAKGHDGLSWFLGGFFLGPFALIASVGLPDKNLSRSIRFLIEQKVDTSLSVSDQSESSPEDPEVQKRRMLGSDGPPPVGPGGWGMM